MEVMIGAKRTVSLFNSRQRNWSL